jgi:hypothetical protein
VPASLVGIPLDAGKDASVVLVEQRDVERESDAARGLHDGSRKQKSVNLKKKSSGQLPGIKERFQHEPLLCVLCSGY